ncbi:putative polysaccharide biosynthesis protein [[Clostridium] polysaccharolyticum]|nr:polysaccharide biosynthesis protein [[Clostridium] polysaccharolyticum]
MGKKDNKDGFIVQASILAATGIICRIIGLLYRSPLTSVIGDEGNGYYSNAYNMYAIILLISSYSIPSAVSKVIAERLALRQYKNAHRIFKCALIYVVIVGGIFSLFTFFGAKWLVPKSSVVVLRIFAPTIFFSGLLGVLRGYFQAHGTMVQTSFSQIIEQILNAVVSIGAAYMFTQAVADKDHTTRAVYGAAGSALGTGAGVLIALIFMYLIYLLNRNYIRSRIAKDRRKEVDSYQHIFQIIFLMVTPVILSTFIYNSSTVVNQKIYHMILKAEFHMPSAVIASNYGVFGGKTTVIMNIPIALASAMAAAMIPMISGSYATGDEEETNNKIQTGIRTTMLISIPCSVAMFVLPKEVVGFLFPQKESLVLAADLLRVLSVSVIFYALSTLTNGVLQGIGKVNVPMINAAVALIVQTVVLVAVLYLGLGLFGLALAMNVYSFVMCVLNQVSIRKYLGYGLDIIETFIKPLIASFVMGAIAWGSYYLFSLVMPIGNYSLKNRVCLTFTIVIAMVAYFAIVLKMKILDEEDMRTLPKGNLLIRAAKKLRLL